MPATKKKVHRRNPPVNLTLPPGLVAWAKDYARDSEELKSMSNLVTRELAALRREVERQEREHAVKSPALDDSHASDLHRRMRGRRSS